MFLSNSVFLYELILFEKRDTLLCIYRLFKLQSDCIIYD